MIYFILKIGLLEPEVHANPIFSLKPGRRLKVAILIGVLSSVCFVSVAAFILFLLMRNRSCRNLGDDVHLVNSSVKKRSSLKEQFFKKEMEGKENLKSNLFYGVNASIGSLISIFSCCRNF